MDTDAEETRDEDEEEKDSSCPVSEDRREQERRSTVCRELQRRSSGTHCSVTFTQPETHTDRKCRHRQEVHTRTGSAGTGQSLPARFR